MAHVDSSQIISVGYDKVKNILYLQFYNGYVYSYSGVDEEHYKTMITPTISPGKYFAVYIKGNYFYNKLKETVINNILEIP